MGSTKRFWQGMLLGAIVGGAISLFDRQTREAVIDASKKSLEKTTHYVTHPNEVVEVVKEKTERLRNTVEEVSDDIAFIAEKVSELRDITPQVANLVSETKEAFIKPEERE